LTILKVLEEIFQNVGILDHRLYRGQSNSGWELDPTLFREFEGKDFSEKLVLSFEKYLAHEFQRAAPLQLPLLYGLPKPEKQSFLAWWVYMQHYGAPTRLLDWTRSPFVALYFAVRNNPEKDGAVWHFDSLSLGESFPDSAESRDWSSPSETDTVYTFQPLRPTEIILQQEGEFTVYQSCLKNHNSGLKKFDLNKIVIPSNKKRKILKLLQTMNISAATLFPGLDGVGRGLKESLKESIARMEHTQ